MNQTNNVRQTGQIDLHTHSTCSDGTLTPTELITYAKEKNLSAIALTDHDTVSGLAEAAAAARENSIEFINGIELGVMYDGMEVHILGLFLDPDSAGLRQNLPDIRQMRQARNKKMLALFNNRGFNISTEDFPKDTEAISRAHFARALVAKGYCQDLNEAFEKYLSPGCETYVPRQLLTAKDGIELIEQSSGISFLAHPLRYGLGTGLGRDSGVEALVRGLTELGLMGIEVFYSANNQADDSFLLKMAKKYRLKISGGSDFHGLSKNGVDLGNGYGNLYVPGKILENLKSQLSHI